MSDGERRQMGGMYGRQHYRREVRQLPGRPLLRLGCCCWSGLLLCLLHEGTGQLGWLAGCPARLLLMVAAAHGCLCLLLLQEEDEEDEAPVDDVKKIQGGWRGGIPAATASKSGMPACSHSRRLPARCCPPAAAHLANQRNQQTSLPACLLTCLPRRPAPPPACLPCSAS